MTNDEAREAGLDAFEQAGALPTKRQAFRNGWNDAIAHLRATGQLCTVEEREVLRGLAEGQTRLVDVPRSVYLARRVKGGSDVG